MQGLVLHHTNIRLFNVHNKPIRAETSEFWIHTLSWVQCPHETKTPQVRPSEARLGHAHRPSSKVAEGRVACLNPLRRTGRKHPTWTAGIRHAPAGTGRPGGGAGTSGRERTDLRRRGTPASFTSASLLPESNPKLDTRNGDTRHAAYVQGQKVRTEARHQNRRNESVREQPRGITSSP